MFLSVLTFVLCFKYISFVDPEKDGGGYIFATFMIKRGFTL